MQIQHDPAPKRRWRPGYSAVASTLALVLALGGTAYALVVTSADIQNGTIQTEDLHKNAVTGNKVKNGTLTGSDIENGTIDLKDLTAAAQQDPRLQTFAAIAAPDNVTPAVIVSTTYFTFTGWCLVDQGAYVQLESTLGGVNFVKWRSQRDYLGSESNLTQVAVDVDANTEVGFFLSDLESAASGGVTTLSGIAPAQGGSVPAVLVQVTVTGVSAGCAFTGTVTDTTDSA